MLEFARILNGMNKKIVILTWQKILQKLFINQLNKRNNTPFNVDENK